MTKIDINVILKLPLWQRLLILAVIWLIIAGCFYYFLYGDKVTESGSLASRLETLKLDAEKKRRIAQDLPKFKQEKIDLDRRFREALAQLPNEKEMANLLESLSDAAKAARLDILSFRPGAESVKGFYAEVNIDMKVEGSYGSLMVFFEKVANLPRIVNVADLNITSGKEARGEMMLSATFKAITFKFVSQ